MIEARSLTKRYGPAVAVSDLSFTIKPGMVTGFLGPNGAGKTATMRMILGLDRPTAGAVTVGGVPYASLKWPMRDVGAMLAKAWHALPGGMAYVSVPTCPNLGIKLRNFYARWSASWLLQHLLEEGLAVWAAPTFSDGGIGAISCCTLPVQVLVMIRAFHEGISPPLALSVPGVD